MIKLKSQVINCHYCGSNISDVGRSATVSLYTRSGTMEAEHHESRCKNRDCRVGYRYGYHTINANMIYDDPFDNEYILTSQNTGFQLLYLYEVVILVFHGSCSITSLCDSYNSLHYFSVSKDMERFTLNYQRVIRGFYTYALLDLSRRYKISLTFDRDDIDKTIEIHFEQLTNLIQEKWGNHRCEARGCGSVLVIDGGLKPQRKICAARTCAIYQFKHSGAEVLVGCKNIPSPGETFCSEHVKNEVPSVPSKQMDRQNVKCLRKTRHATKSEKVEEDVFNIVAIHKKKKIQKGQFYLIEWEGYSGTSKVSRHFLLLRLLVFCRYLLTIFKIEN